MEQSYNNAVDVFRDNEYPMMKGTYTIPSKSLIDRFSQKMVLNLYGNPHSANDPAHNSGVMVERVREEALRFFRADPAHFDLIFTQNATAAIKVVADGFRDLSISTHSESFWYGYHKDAHTSLVGIRELCNGTHHCFSRDREVEDWLDGVGKVVMDSRVPGLFAYPGQSNFTGRRLPLQWCRNIRHSPCGRLRNVYTLLDAASLASTAQIDLSDPLSAPDFMAVSFYKIFGFPDLGALIVRKRSGHILSWRKYFGGGTVDALTVMSETSLLRKSRTLHEALEDGTLPFHNIMALGCALETHQVLYGSMNSISKHTMFLAKHLFTKMSSLRHFNGRPVCVMYNDNTNTIPYSDPTNQGAIIAFNILDTDGSLVPYSTVEKLANGSKIYLRSGGLCNPGGVATFLRVEPWQFKRAWSAGFRCSETDEDLQVIQGISLGVVRASLGAMTTMTEVDLLVDFLKRTFLDNVQRLLPPNKMRIVTPRACIRSPEKETGFEILHQA
ncbi:pyridoxal phosphate-dependent transferase [Calycina marina]|uniref:Pyridoxal phosphate-dependent transferase n=1 Tax=Calycina marina TaxID=1763456 RepID=A0A9P7Z5K2_9HELO|nr:pyridoxal phosphate-dependent transferase [Calycina marina]